jgi:hypothetical protein
LVVILSTPTIVKVAEIAAWIHHSRVKPASLEWDCIPDSASPCRITLQNLSTLLQQDSTSQETMGDQEQRMTTLLQSSRKLTSLCTQKLEESTLRWDKWAVFHTSYLTVLHCHPLSVSAAVVLTLVFARGLAETAPADWSHSERFLFAFFYLFGAGCVFTIYCY